MTTTPVTTTPMHTDWLAFKGGYKYVVQERVCLRLPWAVPAAVAVMGPGGKVAASLDMDGWLTIEPGYAWDGPSSIAIDTETFMLPSLVHDVLYQMLRLELLPGYWKDRADRIMWVLCLRSNMWWVRAAYAYLAVKWFAWWAARRSAEPKVRKVRVPSLDRFPLYPAG